MFPPGYHYHLQLSEKARARCPPEEALRRLSGKIWKLGLQLSETQTVLDLLLARTEMPLLICMHELPARTNFLCSQSIADFSFFPQLNLKT